MPCMCWYDPPEASKKRVKALCESLVKELRELSTDGDPLGCTLRDAHKLIDHLYNKGSCDEAPKGK